jgi:hypothetical protein
VSGDPSIEQKTLLGFAAWWATRIWGVDPKSDSHPSRVYSGMRSSGATANHLLGGLKQAVRDCVSSAADLPVSKVKEIDDELRAVGLPTLSALRVGFTRALARILKNGALRTEDDRYLAANVVDDVGIPISREDRAALAGMIASWDGSSRPKDSSG